MTRTNWDVIVVGGGPAGENAAQYTAQFSGLGAAIVEAELVGGECSYWACMPSKGLLLPVELLDQARHVRGAAEAVGSARVDVADRERDLAAAARDAEHATVQACRRLTTRPGRLVTP